MSLQSQRMTERDSRMEILADWLAPDFPIEAGRGENSSSPRALEPPPRVLPEYHPARRRIFFWWETSRMGISEAFLICGAVLMIVCACGVIWLEG